MCETEWLGSHLYEFERVGGVVSDTERVDSAATRRNERRGRTGLVFIDGWQHEALHNGKLLFVLSHAVTIQSRADRADAVFQNETGRLGEDLGQPNKRLL